MKVKRMATLVKDVPVCLVMLFTCMFVLFVCVHYGTDIGSFIAYGSTVVVRYTIVGFGCLAIGIAMAIKAFGRWKTLSLASDAAVTKWFAAALFVVPFSCFALAVATHCDFHGFQNSSTVFLFLYGGHVALRAKRRHMVAVYIVELLLFGGWSPPL